jgi:predicted DNA-binding antitoxin AbrB/MazE fold protein
VSTIVDTIFDGEVFRPLAPVDLKPNTHYRVIIEESTASGAQDAWTVLESMIGTVEAPADWSAEHGHYLHGSSQSIPGKL